METVDFEERIKVFKEFSKEEQETCKSAIVEVLINDLAEKTEGYSGADIDGLVREAALIAMQESKFTPTEIQLSHFEQAMQKVIPSITKETVDAYAAFKTQVTQAFRPSYVR